MRVLLALGILLCAYKGVAALRLARLDVPAAVIRGDSAWLNCSYTLEGDELYSVKWYKNNVEFYRFLPSDTPPGQKYDLPGVYVDLEKSVEGYVYLTRADLNTEGTYRCEVSAESPSFQTIREEKDFRVYVKPVAGPTIFGMKPQYKYGEVVNVSCKAGPSKPAAILKWDINGREASAEYIVKNTTVKNPDRLQVAILDLQFTVTPEHFIEGGVLKLKCNAVISTMYSQSTEEIIVGDKLSAIAGNGPVISGGKPDGVKYQVGERVDVTCTSSKSKPAAVLKWYINDKPVDENYVTSYKPILCEDGLFNSSMRLQFTVQENHFSRDGEMRIKCTATVSKELSNMSSTEQTLRGGSSQQSSGLHISENTGAVINRGSTIGCLLQTLFVSTFLAALL